MLIRLRQQRWIQCGLLCMLFLRTVITLSEYPFLKPLGYLIWGSCCIGFVMMSYMCLRKPEVTRFDMYTIVYYTLLFVITIVSGNDIKSAAYCIIEIILLLAVFNYFSDNFSLTVKASALVWSAIIYGNLAMMVLYPDWIYAAEDTFTGYLLGGNYNQMGGRIICGCVTNALCLKFGRQWMLNVSATFVAAIVTLLLVGSMTSSFCVLLFTIYCIFPSFKVQKIGLVAFFVFYLCFQFFVCFSGEGLQNNPIAVYIIEDVLGKDMSFTYRTTMWDAAGKLFVKSPIWGFGLADEEWWLANLSSLAKGPHNFIYGIMLSGGLLLLSVFVMICSEVVKKILKFGIDRMYGVLLMGILTWLFMGTMEVYPTFFIIYLLLLAFYYPRIKGEKEPSAEPNTHPLSKTAGS